MGSLRFRDKLLLAMMLVVAGVAALLLTLAQRRLQNIYNAQYEQDFKNEAVLFATRRELRLSALLKSSRDTVRNVRLVAWLNEINSSPEPDTIELLYETMRDEFDRPGFAGVNVRHLSFFRCFDAEGKMLPMPKPVSTTRQVDASLGELSNLMASHLPQEIGYLALELDANPAELHEVILTKFTDRVTDEQLGALLLAVPYIEEKSGSQIQNGLWVGGRLHSSTIPSQFAGLITERIQQMGDLLELTLPLHAQDSQHVLFLRRLNPGSTFPPACQVSIRSTTDLEQQQQELKAQVAGVGALALLGALALSIALSHGLARPIYRLVGATREISRGNYEVQVPVQTRDEMGTLATAFNEMAGGLLLKEKYRSVLDKVSDPSIAEELVSGKIELGGEERFISVLFCDIRGFTGLTEKMEPDEVIQMLNEHFTPLTRVVQEHHGATDKFVGDLIMAVFGAPKSFGNDAANAVNCALAMIRERERLNRVSKYQIRMGIGIASGSAVAGCMGSKDRLNYTVLGPKVNLASRLCGQAGPMEIVIDEETFDRINRDANAMALPDLKLKGFATPVRAFKLHSPEPKDEIQAHAAAI